MNLSSWQVFKVVEVLVSARRLFVDLEVLQVDDIDLDTVQDIDDPRAPAVLKIHT